MSVGLLVEDVTEVSSNSVTLTGYLNVGWTDKRIRSKRRRFSSGQASVRLKY